MTVFAPSGLPVNSEGINEVFIKFRDDPHVRAQAERVMPVLHLVQGIKDCRTMDQLVSDLAYSMAVLELNPHIEQTANHGGIVVTRGPREGYGVYVWTADIYTLHLSRLPKHVDPEHITSRTPGRCWVDHDGQTVEIDCYNHRTSPPGRLMT